MFSRCLSLAPFTRERVARKPAELNGIGEHDRATGALKEFVDDVKRSVGTMNADEAAIVRAAQGTIEVEETRIGDPYCIYRMASD